LGVIAHRALDRLAEAAGAPIPTLMESAGRQVANAVALRWPPMRTYVLCGPGSNGGDGYVVARHLAARGFKVTVLTVGATDALPDPVAGMALAWRGPLEPWQFTGTVRQGLYVDAVFGAGLNRAIPPELADFYRAVRSAGCPIVAVDVPSGLHGDRAAFLGPEAWSADLTVTFFRKKPAHVLMPGRTFCGEIAVADIGIPEGLLHALTELADEGAAAASFAQEIGPPLALWPYDPNGHKYQRGHCVVVAGGAAATGAARLSARAALRAGAGLVTLAAAGDAAMVCAQHVTCEMVASFEGPEGLRALLADPRKTTVVIGPGLGRDATARALVETVLSIEALSVLDADALSLFEGSPDDLFQRVRSKPGKGVVFTPHEGEFERLFPGLRRRAVNKIEAARIAADQSSATLVLKGPDTVVCSQKHPAMVNTHAPPWLATAGSGDVLAGLIGGLLAQGLGETDAAVTGVWLHGEAATLAGPGLIASDLADMLPFVLKKHLPKP
jgi:NAD(P)H-hydrate epimerase